MSERHGSAARLFNKIRINCASGASENRRGSRTAGVVQHVSETSDFNFDDLVSD